MMSPPTPDQIERGRRCGIFFGSDDTEETAAARFAQADALRLQMRLDAYYMALFCIPRGRGPDWPW